MKINKLRHYFIAFISSILFLSCQQSSYAALSSDFGSETQTVAEVLGLGAVVGLGVWGLNHHGNNNNSSQSNPCPTPPPPPVITGGPLVLSGLNVSGKPNQSGVFTTYNLQSRIDAQNASGRIIVKNTSNSALSFIINPVSQRNDDIVVDPSSSCYSSVAGGANCEFLISYNGFLANKSKKKPKDLFIPELFKIEGQSGGATVGSDYITINAITTDAGDFFNPAVEGTEAHSIFSTKVTSLLKVVHSGVNVLYAGTDGFGIFESTNSGQHWLGVNNGLENFHIVSLATDGTNLYAAAFSPDFNGGVSSKIYKSSSNGAIWEDITGNIPEGFKVASLAWDGKNLYAGGRVPAGSKNSPALGGVFIKNPNDNTWTQSAIPEINVGFLYFDGTNLYACGLQSGTPNVPFGGGIYKKDPTADSWTASLQDHSILNVVRLGNYLYAINGMTTPNFIERSTDGVNWVEFSSGLPTAVSAKVLFADNGSLYVGTTEGEIFQIVPSNGAANETTNISLGLIPGHAVSAFASDGTTLYAASYGGGAYIKGSVNQAQPNEVKWFSLTNGLANVAINSILNPSGNAGAMFVGVQNIGQDKGCGVFKSFDMGANWIADNEGFKQKHNFNIQSLYAFGNIIYAGFGGEGGAYSKSLTDDTGWAFIKDLKHETVNAFYGTALENATQTLFAGTVNSDVNIPVYRSNDGGLSWINSGSFPDQADVTAIAAGNSGKIFAGTKNGVYRYSNDQTKWVKDGLGDKNVYALSLFDGFYAGTAAGMFKRSGSDWNNDNTGALSTPIDIRALFAEATANDAYLYAGGIPNSGNPHAIFRKSNIVNGDWELVHDDFDAIDIISLFVLPGGNAVTDLFAGTQEDGMAEMIILPPRKNRE